MKRWATGLMLALVVLFALVALGLWVVSKPVPEGRQGPAADAFARELQRAVAVDRWRATPAVQWVFFGRHRHVWDRQRGLSWVRWDEHDVVLDVGGEQGCAWVDGKPQRGEALRDLLDGAYARFINDSFWLNPLGKLFDPGAERRLVEWEGEQALLVTFTSNGLTPGDSYLWLRGEDGRPRKWHMWTRLPIQGLGATWEGWKRLATGAWVATHHAVSIVDVDMTDVAAAVSVVQLPGVQADPFARCATLSSR